MFRKLFSTANDFVSVVAHPFRIPPHYLLNRNQLLHQPRVVCLLQPMHLLVILVHSAGVIHGAELRPHWSRRRRESYCSWGRVSSCMERAVSGSSESSNCFSQSNL